MNSESEQLVLRSLILTVALFGGTGGCSISGSFSDSVSNSSESASKIVSSPFTSSSRSISSNKKEYQQEVADYTNAYVRSSTADYDGFRKGLAEVANKYGISNWEAQPLTYTAIGQGLKKAGLKGIEYETFKKNLAGGEPSKMQDIDAGYRGHR